MGNWLFSTLPPSFSCCIRHFWQTKLVCSPPVRKRTVELQESVSLLGLGRQNKEAFVSSWEKFVFTLAPMCWPRGMIKQGPHTDGAESKFTLTALFSATTLSHCYAIRPFLSQPNSEQMPIKFLPFCCWEISTRVYFLGAHYLCDGRQLSLTAATTLTIVWITRRHLNLGNVENPKGRLAIFSADFSLSLYT